MYLFGVSRGATEARIFCNWLEYAPNVTTSGSGASKFFLQGIAPCLISVFDVK